MNPTATTTTIADVGLWHQLAVTDAGSYAPSHARGSGDGADPHGRGHGAVRRHAADDVQSRQATEARWPTAT